MENWQTPGMTRYINKKRGCEKMTYIFSQPFFDERTRPVGVGVKRVQKGGSGRPFGNIGEPL